MKRFVRIVLLFIIGCLIAAFAVANRQPVRFIADPFIDRNLATSFEAPFFIYLFISMFIGVLLGAGAAWAGQGRWRRAARKEQKEATLWKREAENLKRGLEATTAGAVAPPAPRPLRSYL